MFFLVVALKFLDCPFGMLERVYYGLRSLERAKHLCHEVVCCTAFHIHLWWTLGKVCNFVHIKFYFRLSKTGSETHEMHKQA